MTPSEFLSDFKAKETFLNNRLRTILAIAREEGTKICYSVPLPPPGVRIGTCLLCHEWPGLSLVWYGLKPCLDIERTERFIKGELIGADHFVDLFPRFVLCCGCFNRLLSPSAIRRVHWTCVCCGYLFMDTATALRIVRLFARLGIRLPSYANPRNLRLANPVK